MMTNILGVTFEVFENGLIAEDMSISIFCTDEQAQSFSFVNANLNNYSDFFNKYNCTSILFSTSVTPAVFNIDAIKNRQRIKKLGLSLEAPTEVEFKGHQNPFDNLEELSFTGSPPSNFPSLDQFSKLKKLMIEYDQQFTHAWIELTHIQDLHITSYGEADLHLLKGLSSLRRLKIEHGTMKSLDGIEHLQSLETLIISGSTSLSDIDAILLSKNLKNVMFEGCKKIKEWDILGKKKDLLSVYIDTATSIDFMKNLPNLDYFFCKKAMDRNKKSILYSTKLHQDKMRREGIQITTIPTWDLFFQPLDAL